LTDLPHLIVLTHNGDGTPQNHLVSSRLNTGFSATIHAYFT